nr:ABC transporter ATP-binding protein [uncultured Clostridium sp.]
MTSIVFEFFETLFDAFSFKNLFLCFSEREVKYLVLTVVFAVLAYIIAALGRGFTNFITKYSDGKVKVNLKNSLITKVLDMPLDNLGEHSGEILSLLNQDVDIACEALNNAVDNVLIPFIQALCYLCVTYVVSWQMGLFYTVSLIPIIIVNLFFNDKFHNIGLKIQKSLSTLNEKFQDIISGARFIKLYMLEKVMEDEIKDCAKDVFDVKKDEQKLKFKYMSIANIFSHSFVTFPILIGCYLVSIGKMLLPDVMFVSRYTYSIRYLATALIKSATEIPRQSSGAERVYNIFHKENESERFGNIKSIEKDKHILSLYNLSVEYRGKKVVNNFSLNIKEGEKIALVGSSGSGKSTIIKSLMSFVNYNGDIKLWGKSFKDYDLYYLRSLMSYVPQESTLFNCSIYENILYGNLESTKEEVINAAKLAYAHDFIMELPEGYDTKVGENGSHLSGGQRQRICIARAFLKNSPILFLDEATSALDSESENEIQMAINNIMKGRTIVMVAHRLSTVVDCDRIYVINEGKVLEEGNHEELIKKNGNYKKMYELQK